MIDSHAEAAALREERPRGDTPAGGRTGTTVRPRRRKLRRVLTAAGFLAPGFLLYGVFVVGPMLYSLRISFYDWNIVAAAQSEWVGIANYTRALTDPTFLRAVANTTVYAVVTVPAQIVIGVGLALLLNQAIRGRAIFRVLYYLPVVVPWVIVALLFKYLFVGQGGVVNYLLRDVLGIIESNLLWLADEILIFVPIHLLGIWKGVGWTAIIALAGLQTIPRELEEAAEIDGAGTVARFRYVILPLLRPTLTFLTVVLAIGALNAYVSNLLITDGGQPFNKTHFVLTLMYQETFSRLDFGYGAAISYLLTAIVFAISLLQIRLMKRRNEL